MAWILSNEFSGRVELKFDESNLDELDAGIENPNEYSFSLGRRNGNLDNLSLTVSRRQDHDIVGTDGVINNSVSRTFFWRIDDFAKLLSKDSLSEELILSNSEYPGFRLKVVDVSEEDLEAGYNTKVVFPALGESFRLGESRNRGIIITTYALLKRISGYYLGNNENIKTPE